VPTQRTPPSPRRCPPAASGPAPRPRRSGRPTIPWGLLIALTLITAIGVTAAVVVGQVFHGR
jgi:amino acid transporter